MCVQVGFVGLRFTLHLVPPGLLQQMYWWVPLEGFSSVSGSSLLGKISCLNAVSPKAALGLTKHDAAGPAPRRSLSQPGRRVWMWFWVFQAPR